MPHPIKIVALLESMWGWRGYHTADEKAPRFYRINPENLSGRRLYRICGDNNLIVTNSCRFIQKSANHHGTPDIHWTKENLTQARQDGCDLFLICGRVAKETYDRMTFFYPLLWTTPVMYIDHPAARRWSNEKLDNVKAEICRQFSDRSKKN